MRLSPSRLAVPLAAVVLSFSMSASAQDGAPPPVAPAAPAAAPPAAPPAAAPAQAAPAEASPTERSANNALYVELLGAGLFYSLDYDRAFGPIAGRIGIGYFSISSNSGGSGASASFISIPVTVSYLGIGSLKHMFEVGAGVSINYFSGGASFVNVSTTTSVTEVYGTVVLGYRFQPPDGGFFLRAGVDPIIGNFGFLPWPYVGLGATF
jgi:hypothetical protein